MDTPQKILEDFGIKKTKQRIAILEILYQSEHPMTAEEIYTALSKNETSIWLSTVYRALESLSEKGILNKVFILKDNKNYYEMKWHSHRHYLICLNCNKMLYLNQCPIKHIENLAADNEFKILDHKLELYGYCKECQMLKKSTDVE